MKGTIVLTEVVVTCEFSPAGLLHVACEDGERRPIMIDEHTVILEAEHGGRDYVLGSGDVVEFTFSEDILTIRRLEQGGYRETAEVG